MKFKIQTLFALIFPFLSFAQDKGIDQIIDEKFGDATGWFVNFIFYQIQFTEDIKVFWVLFPLILGATYFTIYFKFINFRGILTSINIVRGKYDSVDHHETLEAAGDATPGGDSVETIAVEGHEGEVSHFEAIPKSPAMIIQKVAPAPPMETAIATPAIFPSPTVADRAAVSA